MYVCVCVCESLEENWGEIYWQFCRKVIFIYHFIASNTAVYKLEDFCFRSLEVVIEPGTFDSLQKLSLQKWTNEEGEKKMQEKNREITVCLCLMRYLLCVYVFTCVCVCLCVCVCICLHVCVCVCVCVYMCVCACVCICLHVCVYVYVCAVVCFCICVCMYAHFYAHSLFPIVLEQST